VREDASTWSDAEVAARLAEEAYRPFSLDQGSLLRVLVLERTEPVLLLAVHHIAADFASLAVIARDLGALYRQETGGPAAVLPEPMPYAVHVRREREMLAGPEGERRWDFWRAALAGERGPVPDLDLPADRPRPPVQTWNGGARTVEIPADLAERLRAFAAAHGATLFMTLLAAFQAQLGRISGQEDLAVGSPFAGRGAPELAEAVGYLVNPVPLRADLTGDPAFAELLARTRAAVVAGLGHGDFPFALLAERLRPVRDPSRSPLFQTMFLVQRNRPGDPPGLATFALGESGGRLELSPGLTLESLRLDERRAQLDLTLRVAEEAVPAGPARLRASLEYNSDLFDGATAERMLGHFTTLLAGAVADPAASRTPISRLPLLTAAERTAVLVDWNAPAPGHPAGHRQDLLLHQPFEAQAALTPEAEALVAERRLTYAELSRRANQLAWHLQAMGVGPEVRVGVHLPRSADLVVSLLAVLKAGGAYVPLDPNYPRERLELMLADSGARLVIEDGTAADGWLGASPRRLDLAAERDVLAACSSSDPPAAALPGNLAYLIYTSGSTGRPKAVAVEHRSAAVLMQWARGVFAPAELAGVLAATSVAFDLSVFELFVPLSWGGRVILAENALELPRLAAAGEVTLVNTVPSALAELVRGGGLPAAVRTVNLAGEPVPRALADAVHALPGVERFYNLYGPSEDTTYSTFALLAAGEPAGAPVSIGLPVDDTVAYIVDRRGEPVPVGVPGELRLGGAGLARGYLGRPELTAERFVPDPFGGIGARLYRTGDLVRRRTGGRLDFLGRIDHQVKIRGFRIELGEVEAALTAHPEVREAVVLALPEPGGAGQRLVAYVVGAQPAALRAYLRERLPEAFVPTAWVVLPSLPLSPNGKVDRKALAAIEPQAVSGAAATAGTAVEEAVAGLFAEALGVPAVGLHDDFFALGGHSLLATRVLGRVARLFAVDLPVSALFQAPTAARLASLIAAAAGGAASAPPIVPVSHPHEDAAAGFPLSFAQQRLWFLDQLQPGGAAYNMPGAVLLEGPLHPGALAAALSAVARRHESLRTRFAGRGGRPVQIVDPPAPVALPVVDLTALPETARETAAAALSAAEAARPFDLTRGRLLRALLLRLSAERHLKLVTLHHIVADGWSLGVLVAELAAFYRGDYRGEEPAPLAVHYADFAVWQRQWFAGGALAPQLAWWKERLAGAPTHLELPADRPRRTAAARTEQGVHVHAPLARELAAALRGLAPGTTLFMVLLAAFEALLARITGQDDLLLGSVVANRTRPETEGLIGLFANTLVLRARLEDDPPFATALARARETALGAWAHQDLPLEVLVEELHPERETGRTPLFQAVLVQQNAPLSLAPLELPGLTLRRVPVDSATAKFDLTLEVGEEADGGLGGLEMAWELSRDLFDAATGHRLAGWLGALLRGAVAAPGTPLSELPLLDDAERRQLLADGNPALPSAPLATPVHRLFEEWAARAPERIAVVSAGGEPALTYGELNARANRLARHLRVLGVGPETRVGVAVERSPEQVTAFLAVLKAGGAYVPMDLSDPLERLAAMDAAAEVELMLSEELLAADAETVAAHAPENLSDFGSGPDPGTLAYVMFTSGSTGRPKAVAVEHRGIVRLVRGAGFADFGPDQVFLQLAPTAFDASTLEIWGALLGGGRLVLAPGGVPSLDDLAALLERQGVTTLWLTAGLFHLVVEERIGILRGLTQLLAGGDVLAPEAVNRVLAELPGVRLINGYGPTENTTFTCCHTVRERVLPGDTVPIGRPISGTRVLLLDRRLRPVPAGVPGELFAGGAGLARGYLGRPDLTAERFVPDPLAAEAGEPGARLYRTGDLARRRPGLQGGVIEFLGRADRQVKIRGFRVEPGEVEAVLAGHPAVARATVLVLGESAEARRLVACAVPAAPAPEPAGVDLAPALKSWLAERLPSWLVPSVVLVPELPLTANGKVDRAALALLLAEREGAEDMGAGSPLSPAAALPARPHPLDPAEELLAGILAEVLGVERVGLHDDFFALGGHSLLATRAVSRIVDALKVELPLSGFFATPTVAGLAERLRTARGAVLLPPVVPVPRDVPLPLSFAQQRLWFLDRLRPGGTAYNLPVAARLTGDLDAAVLARCLTEIVRRHEALRTVFAEDGGRPVQLVRPAGPAALTCIDLSGLAAAGRWDRALEIAAREAALPFDLATGPVVRFALVTLAKGDHLLVAAFHHIAADGWSLPVFLGELAALYGAFAAGRPSPLPELSVQYGDFAVWQRKAATGPAFARSLAFWRWRLADAEPLDLATDRPRAAGAAGDIAASGPLASAALDLAGLSASVALRAREAGATRFMVLLCGVLGWLSRLTGQTDLTISTPTAGRDRVETEGLIGFFANTLPLRTDLAGDPALDDLLPRVRATVLEAYGNGAVPFERLVEELCPERSAGRIPFADSMLSYLSQPPIPAIPGLGLAPLDLPSKEAKLDLEVAVYERDGALTGLLEGRAGRFEAATLARMAAHLRTLLAGALAEPARRLSELPLLSAVEREEIAAWSRTEAAGAPELVPTIAMIAETARQAPDAAAVEMGSAVLTYGGLIERAGRLARHLATLGVRPEAPVGVCLERSPEQVIAFLAVLAAGGVYLPLDPAYPRERLELLLADSGARVLVTRSTAAPDIAGEARAVVLLDQLGWGGETAAELPGAKTDPQALAYLIYTSGSSGRPKGVGVSHGALAAHCRSARQIYGLAPGDRCLGFASPGFDVAVEQILVPLVSGATQVLSGGRFWAPDELSRQSGILGLTMLDLPTAYWQRWTAEGGAAKVGAAVRGVLVGGEEMAAVDARDWLRNAPSGVRLINGYGPTEAVITATQWVLDASGDDGSAGSSVPVGRPLPGHTAYVLDAAGELLPAGAPGELALGGVLARGYHGAPALTAERFVPDPFGGIGAMGGGRLYRSGDRARWRRVPEGAVLDCLGRLDGQVKIRGFRVEVGEVETALRGHPGVVAAAVLAVPDAPAGRRLAAWIVPAAGREDAPAPPDLAAFLAARLPAHMIPVSFACLAALPLTPHGKIDRRALAASPEGPRGGGRGDSPPPRNAAEESLARLWCELLGVERVGAYDDFFQLGGHSLLATQLTARVRAVFGVDLPLSELFAAPTLAGIAQLIEAAGQTAAGAAPPLRRRQTAGDAPLSFAQQRLWFLHQLEPESPAYHVSGALHLAGPLRPGVLARALERIAVRHEALRTVFVDSAAAGGPVQRVLPPSPFQQMPVVDLGGLAAAPAAAERLGLAEARRLFDLERGPLFRALLLRLAAGEHLLVVVMHHIISDGWSMGVMAGELAALYDAFAAGGVDPLPELALQVADVAVWQRSWLQGEVLDHQLAWWRERLAGAPSLELAGDRPLPPAISGRGGRGASLPVALPADLTRDLHALARGAGATLFMTLLSAFAVLLQRRSGEDDLTVGSPIANRERWEIEPLIGCFVNTLPLRVHLDGDPTFQALLGQVREMTLGAYDHQGVPFEKLVEDLAPERDRARTPLFQVMLVLQNAPQPPFTMGGLTLALRELPTGTAKFDLTLSLADEGGELRGALEYSAGLFLPATAERLSSHFGELLRSAAATPGRRISELSWLTAGERAESLRTGRELPAHLVAAHRSHRSRQERRTPARRHREEPAGRAADGGRPRTPTEELLAALWCEVLGRQQVGVHDSFFDLGGHSLLATRLASRVRATFGSEIPLAHLFDAPTIAELARVLDEARGTGADATMARTTPIRPIPHAARGGDLPLSFAQERLWFLDRIQQGAGVYNVPLALRLRGALEVSRMAAAFGAIVARHEALRTVFPERDGDPVQRIQPPADPALWSLPVVDLAALPEPAAGDEARRLAIADSLVPFSLESGPLLRTTLLRLAGAEYLLLLDLHHIVSDGWSLGVLLGELSAFYGGTGSDLPGLPVQYADFAAWQREWLRGGELERQTAYWKRQLAGAPAVLELPTDRPRPLVQSWRGAQIPILLPAPLTARLAALCRRQGATLFMLLLAAWDVLLHRHSGQRDLNVGSPIAGRNRAETERLIGFFVNTLVLRSTLDDDPSFAGLLARTRQIALAAYDHQDLPFEKLVDEIKPERTMSHEPLFQVMFALQNTPLGALELPGGLSLEPLELRAVVAKFDLTLSLMESRPPGTAELDGMLEYNSELFDAASVMRLLGHFHVLLEEVAAVASGPGPAVSELPLLTAAERHQLLVEWSNAPSEPLGHCLHELFEVTVAADPEALAVVWEDMALSYGELNRRANQLAWHLIALGVEAETRVGLCVERSAEMLVGMLGVLKAGGAYVPIDPAYPRERLAFMLEDTRAPILVTQERLRELLPAGAARVLCLDADWEEISRRPGGNPPPAAVGSNTAYVIYTSGSTGTPKGVVTSHDAVVAYTQASSAVYRIRPGDRNLQFSSISFDASVEEIYGCLTHGATLYVRGDVQEGISEFFDRCRAQKITLLQFPTAFWHQLVTAMEAESLTLPPTIRAMFVGGEKMLAQRLISWWRLLPPGLRFINAYGPTETTVAATVCQLPEEAPIDDSLREVPLGRPLVHARGYVLDRELRPVPIGVTGEMLVGGLGLARGYLDRPALTAEKFVPNPYAGMWGRPGERLYRTGDLVRLLPGGLLELVGRADGQMKLRGYRIEPGEIEATLAGHPGVGQVVVLAREDASGDVRLVAYAAAKGEPAPAPAALRDYLAERLPSYMVPQTVHVLPEMPVSAQGKVDRLALARLTPEVRRERTAWAAPQNEVEQRIAAVWRELFGLDDPDGIGVDDNFFDSGGSSLLLVKLHSRLQKALERTFPLVEIFKHPTIRTLAASLEAGQPARPSLDKARTRTDTRRESMRQMQQLREQRRGRTRDR
jgi:amino acid adenylation domain-containing protein